MDTKLKRISYSPVTKGIAFLLVIICFALSATIFANLVNNSNGFGSFSERDYLKSRDLFYYQQNFYTGLINLLKYKNEDNIRKGNTIDKVEFENRKQQAYFEWYNQIESQMGSNSSMYPTMKERFLKENQEIIDSIYNSLVERELQVFYSLLQRVNNKEGLYYYATNGENTYTNCNQTERRYFTGFKAYYLFDKDGTQVSPSMKANMDSFYVPETMNYAVGNKIYIAVTDEYLAERQEEWDKQHTYWQQGITIILWIVLIMLLALLYLVWRAGRKANDKEVHFIAIDRIYTDINIAITVSIIIAWAAIFIEFIQNKLVDYPITSFASIQPDFMVLQLFNLISCSIVLGLLLSLVRQFKNKTLIRHSMIYTILTKFRDIVRTILSSGPLFVKVAAAVIVGVTAVFVLTVLMVAINSVFSLLLFLILCALTVVAIYYIILRMKPFANIAKGVQEIKNGQLDYIIDIKGEGTLAKLAKDINAIADGLKSAVQKEIKAERMKSELITNVSHDLKTPLTSIINYVDLLSKENLTPEEANDYVKVLKQKSEKLKNLTQDLFEISKLQSGNITVEMERIDIAVLLRQSLAEYDEQISTSGLDFKVSIQDGDMNITADGKRLSRVFENLVLNIIKYSLANTRVYINVYEENNSILIEFKNIANYEMNFRDDEIVERFVRGDKARTTEGNGLGLAIAESYVTACRGTFKISTDGDLFKVTIKFNKA
ncbi:MAG: HAMP domain-containing histidine kinase [Clostridia bacterium]|nr:HAMP domain-containing histidine kinase [Clostridia bacterium]